ncbi:MAG TPA: glycosyltransferase [Terriglobales bacterium]|nr:glycosyltransferase [Terriglobales bacterium]
MKIVICGLSITSSWGNGHATTFRALVRALRARGHEIAFFEKDVEWYASNRDMPEPPFCRVHLYEHWNDVVSLLRREFRTADVAMVGSFFSNGIQALDEMLDSSADVKTFYDIDTPITMAKLRADDAEYLRRDQVPGLDVYFSFTGGPALAELEGRFGASRAVPLYCSFDPDRYRSLEPDSRYQCDLSYMGTYARDRQSKLEELFCKPARTLADKEFLLAGPQYPPDFTLPRNVRRIVHLEPEFHPYFYSSSLFTLNLTRSDMVAAGYSPSVRLFEAAGCGSAIISDEWAGLDSFFRPKQEILLARNSVDVDDVLQGISAEEARKIGRAAQERVLAEHTAEQRAIEFEAAVAHKSVSLHAQTF